MLTQEEIKNLKPGDTVLVEAEVSSLLKDGAMVTHGCITHARHASRLYPLPSEIVNSQSSIVNKHDPTRLFREGDKVRVVEWNGRHFHDLDHGTELTTGGICEVINDEEMTVEEGYLNICVVYEEQVRYIPPCFLELVTPVEELEPYKVDECGFAPTLYVLKNGKVYMTIPYKEGSSLFQTHEEALAAAEAERNRLNAEYRKEQQQ